MERPQQAFQRTEQHLGIRTQSCERGRGAERDRWLSLTIYGSSNRFGLAARAP